MSKCDSCKRVMRRVLGDYCYYGECKQAFQDGAKWGMTHAIQWHDLRKNTDDLPKENGEYRVCYEDSVNEGHKGQETWLYMSGKWNHTAKVIAWCELPKFEEAKCQSAIVVREL